MLNCARFLLVLAPLLLFCGSASAQSGLWCQDADEVILDLHPVSHVLTIDHRAAMYNCCPDPVFYQVVAEGFLLEVTELVLEEAPCDCICCFNTKVDVGPLGPGLWTLRFHWRNEEDWQWHVVERIIVIPDHDGESDPGLVGQLFGECQDTSSVPDPGLEIVSWDLLKSRYHQP